MTVLMLLLLGAFAGALGSMIGIGGGIVLVPVLVLAFGYDIRVAVAASLVAVVATSTSAGAAYVGDGLANMRLGMSLEIATTIGGITGGLVAIVVAPRAIAAIFAGVMVLTAVLMFRNGDPHDGGVADDGHDGDSLEATAVGWEDFGALGGAYVDERSGRLVRYRAEHLAAGSTVSGVAGLLSGLLGVGGGFLKVPAMTLGMKVPIRVAAATSNFMIGVTAISSLVVYFARGYVHPLMAVPIAIGVVGGTTLGTRLAARLHPAVLARVLSVVLIAVAAQMALDAAGVAL